MYARALALRRCYEPNLTYQVRKEAPKQDGRQVGSQVQGAQGAKPMQMQSSARCLKQRHCICISRQNLPCKGPGCCQLSDAHYTFALTVASNITCLSEDAVVQTLEYALLAPKQLAVRLHSKSVHFVLRICALRLV